jgi:hypothetical protein
MGIEGVTVVKSKQIIAGKDSGVYSRLNLGGGRTMVVGPHGYRSYESEDRQGRSIGQDNQGRRWTSGIFAGQEWIDIRKK